ncbi:SDR family NAD(P)-dependent oxidoreductase [Streptomyces sp. DSM 44915]|uniref:SDR family NAD(P)-dependent oxidoreductase n=1 Tax=Streptomyces chisholmiae TaxID=3075540 RepID=A0ABU2JIE1_9ACTN|nr:SDR family NAD(P)-dependent oxidoreductase [Streptomyces sp. DSM 44915]MDT0264749.1 SDR family NAD(P)-dependent oxidoreductase [Streptomyces sp. DSM 44915]
MGRKPTPEPRLSRRGAVGAAAGLAFAGAAAAATGGTARAAERRGGARRFEGRSVLITGGTSGIGRAAAEAFAREGARVAFCGRRERLGRAVERTIRENGGEASYLRADVRDAEQVRSFVDRAVSRYGGPDIALNNAGVQRPFTDLHEVTVEEWDDVAGTNVRGVFLAMKYQIPPMRAAGGGVILVTGSSNQFATRNGLGSYTAAKNGVTGLVQAAALENAAHGIRVVAIAPGMTDTEMLDAHRPAGLSDEEWARTKAAFAEQGVAGLKRMAEPEEIAAAALALASDAFSFQTGTSVPVDGGQLAAL